jgi:hypothetical protein
VRMIQRGEHLRFALEPTKALEIGGKQLRQNLQRDIATKLRVACAKHLAHAPGAEAGEDLERADADARLQRQQGRDYKSLPPQTV